MKSLVRNCIMIAIVLLFNACKQKTSVEAIALSEISDNEELVATVNPLDEKKDLMKSTGFIYSLKPRFNTITKSELKKATSFEDFIGQEHANRIIKYKRLSVILLDGDEQTDIQETGTSGTFNNKQLALLQSFDHSTNLLLWADYDEKFDFSEDLFAETWTPYLTIVPETQTTYSEGIETLLSEIQEQSKALWSKIDTDKLKPARLKFTISKDGTLQNILIDNSCGYGHIDEKMKTFILKSSGKWTPAKDENGNSVEQELVLSYGSMGC
ncbi:hypothetical protein [Psychroserpens sp.]|uniref:energy transducer TonB n=1 Tax=Psychroserpens sp. TaxID=2020870 RepID=UPI001B2BF93E|nr:hypothetical protein [Psychroserpens sp.]MBO6606496.1 hypothetical protein [Psychroserpens sp.]MBO6630408.1 hypothetical protein [Psychroserpens sp.]MBO6653200.1 hypothetical protein [Psychroserpens sp.]MBO6680772.1 hypothetical protein [Psychroserpens sp.]MBO6750270.1 hypothetical protein [Psychroserpens sp.]